MTDVDGDNRQVIIVTTQAAAFAVRAFGEQHDGASEQWAGSGHGVRPEHQGNPAGPPVGTGRPGATV